MSTGTLRARIRAEYLEMPGLRLTLDQARRLFGADRRVCQAELDALVSDAFLSRRQDGTYVRSGAGELPRPRPARAALPASRAAALGRRR